MGFYSTFLNKFKRITGSGNYMPEIDGLRFIAVFLIAFMMHIGNLLLPAQLGVSSRGNNMYQLLLWEAGYGVQLFFMISGFILALPFANISTTALMRSSRLSLPCTTIWNMA